MREASLQANIVELASLLGWRVMHVGDSRRSIGAGWPDLVMVRPPRVLVNAGIQARIAALQAERSRRTDIRADDVLRDRGR